MEVTKGGARNVKQAPGIEVCHMLLPINGVYVRKIVTTKQLECLYDGCREYVRSLSRPRLAVHDFDQGRVDTKPHEVLCHELACECLCGRASGSTPG